MSTKFLRHCMMSAGTQRRFLPYYQIEEIKLWKWNWLSNKEFSYPQRGITFLKCYFIHIKEKYCRVFGISPRDAGSKLAMQHFFMFSNKIIKIFFIWIDISKYFWIVKWRMLLYIIIIHIIITSIFNYILYN